MTATWSHPDYPGLCARCDRPYLLADWVTPDSLGGWRGRCCAPSAGPIRSMRVTVRRAIADTQRLIGEAARMEVA